MALVEVSPSEVLCLFGEDSDGIMNQTAPALPLTQAKPEYVAVLLAAIDKAKVDLVTDWCIQRQLLVGEIEQAISNIKGSYRKATSVKIGGSVFGVLGGVAAVVGYALLIPSFGAALPLAIGGTVAAVGGGISGGAAAIGDAVVQSSISKKVKRDFETSKQLFDSITDKLAEGIADATEVAVASGNSALNERLSQQLKIALQELHYCQDRHAKVLASIGISEEAMSQLPASRRIGLLIQRFSELHTFAAECSLRTEAANKAMSAETPQIEKFSLTKMATSTETLRVGMELLLGLVKIGMFGSAEACNVPSVEAVATSLRPLLRGGIGVAEGVIQGVGKSGALTAARVLGLVGSAAFAVVDLGLLIYYSKQMDDIRRHGRSPELVEELEAMKNTVELQLLEVRERCQLPFEDD